jgi:hypothetical protein
MVRNWKINETGALTSDSRNFFAPLIVSLFFQPTFAKTFAKASVFEESFGGQCTPNEQKVQPVRRIIIIVQLLLTGANIYRELLACNKFCLNLMQATFMNLKS